MIVEIAISYIVVTRLWGQVLGSMPFTARSSESHESGPAQTAVMTLLETLFLRLVLYLTASAVIYNYMKSYADVEACFLGTIIC